MRSSLGYSKLQARSAMMMCEPWRAAWTPTAPTLCSQRMLSPPACHHPPCLHHPPCAVESAEGRRLRAGLELLSSLRTPIRRRGVPCTYPSSALHVSTRTIPIAGARHGFLQTQTPNTAGTKEGSAPVAKRRSLLCAAIAPTADEMHGQARPLLSGTLPACLS